MRRGVGVVLAILALPACQGPVEPGQVIRPIPPESSMQLGDSLAFELEVPDEALLGRSVPLAMRLRNVGPRDVRLELGAMPRTHDFRVLDFREREIWRFQMTFVQPRFEERVLRAGEELVFTAEWPQQNASGMPVGRADYKVRGILFTPAGELTTQTIAFFLR